MDIGQTLRSEKVVTVAGGPGLASELRSLGDLNSKYVEKGKINGDCTVLFAWNKRFLRF